MNQNLSSFLTYQLMSRRPQATARVRGSAAYPNIQGNVSFIQTPIGVLVTAQIYGLPKGTGQCGEPIYAMHIHAGTSCTGTKEMPFKDAKGHLLCPRNCPHPYHAGDLPPLFSNDGYAWYSFLSGRFTLNSVIGRSVIIHSRPDDFTTQPSGNAGDMIACGIIEYVR